MTREEIRAEVKEKLQRYASHTRTEECFISEDAMAKWISGLLASETERCAKLARGWKDSCGERECGHTLDMVPEEIAAMIEDPSKNDSEKT